LGNMGNTDKVLALAVETSGREGSAAVGRGDAVLAEGTLSGRLRHGSELLGCCRRLLESVGARASDIGHIYISAGPGSFTGIRIAVTVAKTMNFACGAKIFPVSTMDVLAENATELSSVKDIGDRTLWLLGEGLVFYRDEFAAEGIELLDESLWYPRAAKLYDVARRKIKREGFADPLTLTPRYLRRPEAVANRLR